MKTKRLGSSLLVAGVVLSIVFLNTTLATAFDIQVKPSYSCEGNLVEVDGSYTCDGTWTLSEAIPAINLCSHGVTPVQVIGVTDNPPPEPSTVFFMGVASKFYAYGDVDYDGNEELFYCFSTPELNDALAANMYDKNDPDEVVFKINEVDPDNLEDEFVDFFRKGKCNSGQN